MSQEMTKYQHMQNLAVHASKSRQYKHVRTPQQALILMQYGTELGFGPATSLQLVYEVNGVPALRANTIGALLKQVKWRGTQKSRYDYRLIERTSARCELEFYERDDEGIMQSRGRMEYTIEDAQQSGDAKRNSNYTTRPKNMLFCRCLTEGARVFAPDCLGGIVPYCVEEMTATDAKGEPMDAKEEPLDAEWEEAGETEETEEVSLAALVHLANKKEANLAALFDNLGIDSGRVGKGAATAGELQAVKRLLDNL